VKSDTATIEARRIRLLELLNEGKSQAQAADILKAEGYPGATVGNIRRTDIRDLAPAWGERNAQSYDAAVDQVLSELSDLKETLNNPAIKPDRKIELTLAILDRRVDILGLNAPKKAIVGHVTQNTAVQYRFLEHAHGLSAEQIEEAFRFMDDLPRKRVSIADCFPGQQPTKLLEDGSEIQDAVVEEDECSN
jgi:hypothetical protein